MKNYFDTQLFLQGIRKVRVLGIVSFVVTALVTLLLPLLTLIGTYLNENTGAYYGEADRVTTVLPFMIIAAPMAIVLFFAPFLVSNAFSFLRKRSHADFYHSLPQSKVCMFITFTASCLAWVLFILVSVGLLGIAIYSALPVNAVFDLWDVLSNILGIFSFAFLLISLSALAVTVTGTAFSWFATFLVILTAIPLYLTLIVSSISTLIPSVNGMEYLLADMVEEISKYPYFHDASYVLVVLMSGLLGSGDGGVLGEIFTLISGAFTVLLSNPLRFTVIILISVGITALGCFIYKKRLSEWAGNAMPNERLRILLTFAFSLPFLLTATHYILGFFASAYSDIYFDHAVAPAVGILILLSVAAWFCAEFFTAKKATKAIISFARFPLLCGICAVYAAACLCVRGSVLSFRPDVNSVAGVRFDTASSESSADIDEMKNHFISDPDVVNFVCYHLGVNTSDLIREHGWNNGVITRKVTFKMKSGATVTRDVCFADELDFSEILLLSLGSEDSYTKTVTTLPEKPLRVYVTQFSGGYSNSDEIYKVFCEEYNAAPFEERAKAKYMGLKGGTAPLIYIATDIKSSDKYDTELHSERVDYNGVYFGIPASFTRTRQLMMDTDAASSGYAAERLMSDVYNSFTDMSGESRLTFSNPSFIVSANGEDLFYGKIEENKVNHSLLEAVFSAIIMDEKAMENAPVSSSGSYIAVNISATKHLSQRSYAIAYYNVTEETAKYIASALQEMQ